MRTTVAVGVLLALMLAPNGCGTDQTAVTPGTDAPTENIVWAPGALDDLIVRHLKQTLSVLRNGDITLKDVAPEYYVEAEPGLTWEQALAAGDKRFPDDPIKRALFVAHYVKAGMQASQLKGLGVPEPLPYAFVGKAYDVPAPYSLGYHAHGFYTGDVDAAPTAEVTFGVNTLTAPRPPDESPFGPIRGTINGPGEVSLDYIQVGGIRFHTLKFDMDGRLLFFWKQPVPIGTSLLTDMGGTWERSENFTSFDVAIFPKEGGYNHEIIRFEQGLKMKEREVFDAETHDLKYREEYEGGRVHRRLHYRDDSVIPWKTEEF